MKIARNVMTVLEAATVVGPHLTLVGQLDRKLYAEVNKVLEAIGGKWDRKAKAHVFEEDAAAMVDGILTTGEYHRVKQDLGQFDTPVEIAALVVGMAGISIAASNGLSLRVLEPSIGIGRIAQQIINAGGSVDGYEIDPARVLKMDVVGGPVTVTNADFLTIEPNPVYDRAVMNPPFAGQADIDHVSHALKFLKAGGRLVAIMSGAVAWRENKKTVAFRELVKALGGEIMPLPEKAFAASGTSVNTCVVTMNAAA